MRGMVEPQSLTRSRTPPPMRSSNSVCIIIIIRRRLLHTAVQLAHQTTNSCARRRSHQPRGAAQRTAAAPEATCVALKLNRDSVQQPARPAIRAHPMRLAPSEATPSHPTHTHGNGPGTRPGARHDAVWWYSVETAPRGRPASTCVWQGPYWYRPARPVVAPKTASAGLLLGAQHTQHAALQTANVCI